MTPNKPLIAQTARQLMQMPDGVIHNNAELELIAMLADVVTHNAGQMNKLVDRISQLEQQVAQQPVLVVFVPTEAANMEIR